MCSLCIEFLIAIINNHKQKVSRAEKYSPLSYRFLGKTLDLHYI